MLKVRKGNYTCAMELMYDFYQSIFKGKVEKAEIKIPHPISMKYFFRSLKESNYIDSLINTIYLMNIIKNPIITLSHVPSMHSADLLEILYI